MKIDSRSRCLLVVLALGGIAANTQAQTRIPTATLPTQAAGDATTQTATPGITSLPRVSFGNLFTDTVHDFGRLRSRDTAKWLAIGGLGAFAVHFGDASATRTLAGSHSLHTAVKPGSMIGSMPVQLGTAFLTYAAGRALHSTRAVSVGSDLVQAQLLAAGLTIGMKQATRRSRPEGGGFSFPSGHTSTTFASATVLQQHFGWKVGAPAYALASYVAVSRVQMKRHHLSDVAFGAALGIVAGRTVSVGIGHGQRLRLEPIAGPDGAGAAFTWVGRK